MHNDAILWGILGFNALLGIFAQRWRPGGRGGNEIEEGPGETPWPAERPGRRGGATRLRER